MKKITHLILLFSVIVSCQKTKVDNNTVDKIVDFSTIEIKVERGAFHYDTLTLKDTTITFYPEKEMNSVEHQDYYKISKQSISKSVRNKLVQKILDADIWDLKEKYTPEGSCTSNLTVIISLNEKIKRIECDDFERGCPDIIKFIESELVRLHGKDLKRVFLPG